MKLVKAAPVVMTCAASGFYILMESIINPFQDVIIVKY